jgi:hypothetical protein
MFCYVRLSVQTEEAKLLFLRRFAFIREIGTFGTPAWRHKMKFVAGVLPTGFRGEARHGISVSINYACGHKRISENPTMRFTEAGEELTKENGLKPLACPTSANLFD